MSPLAESPFGVTKDVDYRTGHRPDLMAWIGGTHASVLDVGCAGGGNAVWYRQHGAIRLVGIEPDEESARAAKASFNKVHSATVENALQAIDGPFDLIVVADVLEHLVDPWTVARSLLRVANPSTQLVVSTPNIRYYRSLARIAVGQAFHPEPSGTFDSTHLRFFTRANLRDLLSVSGWAPERWGYPSYSTAGRIRDALGILTGGLSNEWLVGQWWVSSVPDRHAG